MENSRIFKVLEFRDNTQKMEKANRGKVSLNDTVVLRESETTAEVLEREYLMDPAARAGELLDGERIRELSVRDFVLNDEFKDLGNPAERIRLVKEKSQLPVAKSLSYYLRAIFKQSVPDAAIYGFSQGTDSGSLRCNDNFHHYEVDFSPLDLNLPKPTPGPVGRLHPFGIRSFGLDFQGPLSHPWLYPWERPGSMSFSPGLVLKFPKSKKLKPVKVEDGKYLLAGSRHGLLNFGKEENQFWPNSFVDRRFAIQCLESGEMKVSKIQTTERANQGTDAEVGRFGPEELSKWDLKPQDSEAASLKTFPQALQTFIWSLVTGFNTLTS